MSDQGLDPAIEIGSDDKQLYDRYPELSSAELSRLSILRPGTALEQGATYADLLRPGDGPFQALGGQTAGPDTKIIAKSQTDYELWNRLVPQDRETSTQPGIERPEREEHAVINQANLND